MVDTSGLSPSKYKQFKTRKVALDVYLTYNTTEKKQNLQDYYPQA